jgi:hypothetical protein
MSVGGMYIGHYFAWITAGCMYAVQLLENGETSVAPGPIADLVGGGFGLAIIILCVYHLIYLFATCAIIVCSL